jgi:hypothetical protein
MMPSFQTSPTPEDLGRFQSEELIACIREDFHALAQMFSCLPSYDGVLDGDDIYGIVRALAAIERGIELSNRLSGLGA